jgi:acetyl esterase/lipase
MASLKHCLVPFAALSLTAVAHATPADEARLRPAWAAFDKNHDGKVTLDEFPPMMAGIMKRNDLDGDGAISIAEYVAFDMDPSGASRMPLPANVRLVSDQDYAGTHDPRQALDVYVPKTPSLRGPLPVIAYVHGGGWSTGSKLMGRGQLSGLVNSGRYAGVSIGYRLSWQDPWPAQIHDIKAAIRWIRAHAAEYGFDPKRICAIGPSAGGHLVAKLGLTNGIVAAEGRVGPNLRQSSRVECVVDMFGPVEFESILAAKAASGGGAEMALFGKNPPNKAQLIRDASAINDVDRSDPPFLIVHGSADPTVDYQQSVKLNAALKKAGVPVWFQTVEGGGHGDFGAALPEVFARTQTFFEKMFYDPKIEIKTDTLKK